MFSLHTKAYSHSFIHYSWTTDVTWTVLTMSLLHLCALNVSVVLLSLGKKKSLWFHPKYPNLCSEDEQRFYGFGMTWDRVINDRTFIFGWTILQGNQSLGYRKTHTICIALIFSKLSRSTAWYLSYRSEVFRQSIRFSCQYITIHGHNNCHMWGVQGFLLLNVCLNKLKNKLSCGISNRLCCSCSTCVKSILCHLGRI